MIRRHPNVDDAYLGGALAYRCEERGRVTGLTNDIEALACQEACDSLAQEDVVVGYYDSRGRHWLAAYVPTLTRPGAVVDNDVMTGLQGPADLEAGKAEDSFRRLADEQAALRRVATLVAEGAEPAEVFAAVAFESAHILDLEQATVFSFEPDGAVRLLVMY